MLATATESDETSSSCFPPKASILGHTQDVTDRSTNSSSQRQQELTLQNNTSGLLQGEDAPQVFTVRTSRQQQQPQSATSCPSMWEGSCSDRNAGRQPFSIKTTAAAAVNHQTATFAKDTDEVVSLPRSTSHHSSNNHSGEGDRQESGRSTTSSARSAHDPFTSSLSSMASDLHHPALGTGSGAVPATQQPAVDLNHPRGGLSVVPPGHHQKASSSSSSSSYSPEKGFPGAHHQNHLSAGVHPEGGQRSSMLTITTVESPATISPTVQWTLDQHVPQLMKLLSDSEGDVTPSTGNGAGPTPGGSQTRNIPHADPATQPVAQPAYGKKSGKRAIPQHQPQFTLSSSATPFAPGGSIVASAHQQDAENAQRKSGPNYSTAGAGAGACKTPESSASCFSVTSFNDGEAPANSPDTRNLQKVGCEFVATAFNVLKADPTLARLSPGEDVTVKEIFIGQLPFDFNPAALCDVLRRLVGVQESIVTRFKMGPKPTCAFLTVKGEFEAPLLALTKKILCDNNGMWVARTEVAAAGLQSVSKRRVALKKPGIPQRPMVLESVNQVSHAPKVHHHRAPPTYAAQPGFQQHPGMVPQLSLSQQSGGHQQQQYYHHFGGGSQKPEAHSAGGGMSVCLCGSRHCVAMTQTFGSCSMCARDLPAGVMVRRCPKCPGTDICTVCVAMATSNGSQPPQHQRHQMADSGAHYKVPGPPHSSHHSSSQRALLDEYDHVIY